MCTANADCFDAVTGCTLVFPCHAAVPMCVRRNTSLHDRWLSLVVELLWLAGQSFVVAVCI